MNVLFISLEELMPECTFEIIMFDLMKAIHVELSYKTIHLIMSEVFGENKLLEFGDVLYDELAAVGCPVNDFLKLLDLNKRTVTFRI